MTTLEYTAPLTEAGLNQDQAMVYEVLLRLGEAPASQIAKNMPTSLSRPLVYKVLDELIKLELAEKFDPAGKIATFSPKHPVALQKAIDKRREQLEQTKATFAATASHLTSLYNLASGKPGVQFFEGIDGVREVLYSTLQDSHEVLYSYADTDAVEEYAKEINAEYVKARLAKGIKKKILLMDSALAREKAKNSNELTEIRLISAESMPSVPAVLEIHNQKISYITFANGLLTATTISGAEIYKLHRFLFDSHWTKAKSLDHNLPTSNLSNT